MANGSHHLQIAGSMFTLVCAVKIYSSMHGYDGYDGDVENGVEVCSARPCHEGLD